MVFLTLTVLGDQLDPPKQRLETNAASLPVLVSFLTKSLTWSITTSSSQSSNKKPTIQSVEFMCPHSRMYLPLLDLSQINGVAKLRVSTKSTTAGQQTSSAMMMAMASSTVAGGVLTSSSSSMVSPIMANNSNVFPGNISEKGLQTLCWFYVNALSELSAVTCDLIRAYPSNNSATQKEDTNMGEAALSGVKDLMETIEKRVAEPGINANGIMSKSATRAPRSTQPKTTVQKQTSTSTSPGLSDLQGRLIQLSNDALFNEFDSAADAREKSLISKIIDATKFVCEKCLQTTTMQRQVQRLNDELYKQAEREVGIRHQFDEDMAQVQSKLLSVESERQALESEVKRLDEELKTARRLLVGGVPVGPDSSNGRGGGGVSFAASVSPSPPKRRSGDGLGGVQLQMESPPPPPHEHAANMSTLPALLWLSLQIVGNFASVIGAGEMNRTCSEDNNETEVETHLTDIVTSLSAAVHDAVAACSSEEQKEFRVPAIVNVALLHKLAPFSTRTGNWVLSSALTQLTSTSSEVLDVVRTRTPHVPALAQPLQNKIVEACRTITGAAFSNKQKNVEIKELKERVVSLENMVVAVKENCEKETAGLRREIAIQKEKLNEQYEQQQLQLHATPRVMKAMSPPPNSSSHRAELYATSTPFISTPTNNNLTTATPLTQLQRKMVASGQLLVANVRQSQGV
eukprot:PhM_4_TR17435/c0_g1_i2/m.54053